MSILGWLKQETCVVLGCTNRFVMLLFINMVVPVLSVMHMERHRNLYFAKLSLV